ncbi:MAG TPA: ABC transporter substrate-binding protein [Chloroflexota bacterium]
MVARSHAVIRTVQCSALIVLVAAACASPASSPSQPGAASQEQTNPGHKKVLNLALRTILDGFSISGSPTLQGGGYGYVEIHSQALFTADKTSGRPIPRLLAEQPTQDNGGLQVTSNGKMVATYKLRHDIQWADGAPFTAQDLMFTFALTRNHSMPIVDPGPSGLMDSASTPDDFTFVVNWSQPYYQADALGLQPFWPLPAHLLEADYNRMVVAQKDVAAYMAKPYWTAEYVHVGAVQAGGLAARSRSLFRCGR